MLNKYEQRAYLIAIAAANKTIVRVTFGPSRGTTECNVCSKCNGAGLFIGSVCNECKGYGVKPVKE